MGQFGIWIGWNGWFEFLRNDGESEIGLQENADLLVSLRGAIFFDSKKKGVDQVLISMGIGEYIGEINGN